MANVDNAFAEATKIRGDIRDLMIGALASMDKLWKDMPETDQLALAQILDAHAQDIVKRIAILTASNGRPKVLVTLDSITAGESCKAQITLARDAAALLIPFTKQTVALHVVNAEYFMGEQGPAPTMPDQRPLPMAAAPAPTPPAPVPERIIIVSAERNSEAQAEAEDTAARPRKKPGPKPKAKTAAAKKTGSPFVQ
jgi:hypothetical protein